MPVAVYACDRDGTIIRYNRCAAEHWGRAPGIGDPAVRFCGSYRMYCLDGSPLPPAQSPMADVLGTGTAVRDREVVIERPDGSRIVAQVNVEPLIGDDGQVVGGVACFRDITDRRRAEVALRNSERQFRELVGALPAAVYTTDAAGHIQYFNEAAVALWGSRPAPGSKWCGSWHLYWPDGRPMAHDECPMAVAIREGRAIAGAEAVAERPDGTRVPFLAYPTPRFDETGVLVGAVNTLIDVTDHKNTESVRQWLAAIIQGSDDAIISKDLDGIISSWNRGAERLFGYSSDEIVGRPVTVLIPPERHDEEPRILERIRRGERIDHYETQRRRKDGSLVDISLTVSPIKDAEGRIAGASKIARDITERRRGEERQNLLLREMNHRVKNLFALAIGVVALSARSARTLEDMAAAVRDRLVALARAHELTLPDLSAGPDKPTRSTTLHELARTIVSPYVDADRERITLDGPDVPVGSGASTSLALLLHEFATNAAKYGALSSPAGRLDIAGSLDGGRLLLTWTERGGPRLSGPATYQGFGTKLIGGTVTGQLGGEIVYHWNPEGLVVRLSLSLERLAA